MSLESLSLLLVGTSVTTTMLLIPLDRECYLFYWDIIPSKYFIELFPCKAIKAWQSIKELKISRVNQSLVSESSVNAGAQEQIQEIMERVDDINEKMYEFEANKRNNLIFYGIQAEPRETPSMLLNKVKYIPLTI